MSPSSGASAPKDSRSKRTHSADEGKRTGESTRRTFDVPEAGLLEGPGEHSLAPSENGPGWPGSGGGRLRAAPDDAHRHGEEGVLVWGE
jgi:hypothetical protein